ncbi:MAG TPA: cation-transporting P-type ATPase [Novimethylophilus sp.]|jgi:calcium-translocating P-type ATPase|uniref:cation-translocating P-type ATPase n=1 Tax=Novimethylophilus sp. TaxID=2137426 RepID=UPI002F3E73C3
MKIHQLTPEEALASLNSSPSGLAPVEAARRLTEYGPNCVDEIRREPLSLGFAKEFTHFFALILWLAAGLAFFAEHHAPGQGMATLGWAILGVILINGLFSFWQEYRAEQAIAALQKLLPPQVKAMRDGRLGLMASAGLVPGDIVLLQEGDNVPADCLLLESFALRVNNATVTGESLPKSRNAQPSAEEDLLNARNVLLAGTTIVSGEGRALVFATAMHTEFGKIAHLTQTTGATLSPLQREIVRLSRLVALLATLLGAIFFLIGRAMGLPFWECLLFGIGIIVANVPEGLLPTVTLSLAMATQRMARRNALIRHLPSVEALGAATVICTDKTGTLTQNRMQAHMLWLGGELLPAAAVAGNPQPGTAYRALFEDAALCHNLKQSSGTWLGDPMEVALVELAQTGLGALPTYPKIDEIPFGTDRKRLSTVHQAQDGNILYCKGAPETVLPRCTRIQTDSGILPLDDKWKKRILAAQDIMTGQGLRVLLLAWRGLQPENHAEREQDMVLAGLVGLADPPRPEVPEAIRKCREAGIKVIMVTGDHPHTALAIARQIGLVASAAPSVITGDGLKHLSNTQLQIALDAQEILFARVGADQKMRIVQALKRKGHVVAVTGDGVNDAPALKAADIGIAMGLSGTDAAKAAADMILLDDNFASIVAAIEEGRAVFDNIRKFLSYILTSNIPELVPYLAFALFRIPLPLTIIQILAVDLGTDMLPALGLGAEPPAPDIMQRPPRPRRERLLNWGILLRAYCFLGMMEAFAAMALFLGVLHAAGWHYGEALAHGSALYMQATAATLSTIVVMQIVNVLLCKHPSQPLWKAAPFGNRLILAGIALEIVLIALIDYTPLGNRLFGTAPLPAAAWLTMVPFAALMLLAEEARKHYLARPSVQRV